jgi:hypothetical protein
MPSPASRRSDGERQPQSPGADHCDSDGQTEKEVDKLFRHGTWRTRAAAASAERGPISAAAAGRGALVHDDCGKFLKTTSVYAHARPNDSSSRYLKRISFGIRF